MPKKQEIDAKDNVSEKIKIDYDNIDVKDIMAQIKKRISLAPEPPSEQEDDQTEASGDVPYYTPEPIDEGRKARLKKILFKMMKPFSPIIKLLVYPIHKELRDTILKLDETNRRLDFLYEKQSQQFQEIKRAIDVVDGKVNNFNINTNKRIDAAFKDIHKIKEYTRLLHALSHNMVVEMTKLKIEEENIKLKARIMEKDFEFLGRKEQALEKEIYK
jgi:hypothetical protein